MDRHTAGQEECNGERRDAKGKLGRNSIDWARCDAAWENGRRPTRASEAISGSTSGKGLFQRNGF